MLFVDEWLGCYFEIFSKVNGLCYVEGIFFGLKFELIKVLRLLLNIGILI